MPDWPVLHATPPPGSPSSAAPLQLSSRPLQLSADAATFCWHTSEPAVQMNVPGAQTPGWPVAVLPVGGAVLGGGVLVGLAAGRAGGADPRAGGADAGLARAGAAAGAGVAVVDGAVAVVVEAVAELDARHAGHAGLQRSA